ncbi:MAG TPA: twin-arginine translocation signal domain-containing protein [Tepidisphaeraceae bacterium]|jgi:hypothetical protein
MPESDSPCPIDRREFLKRLGLLGAAAALPAIAGCASIEPGLPAVPKPRWDPARLVPSGPGTPPVTPDLFRSFLLGGFESSTHINISGQRLDLIASTAHDRFAAQDYARLQSVGMQSCRDGARWHVIESIPGHYDFASLLPMARAARDAGMEVIWDLLHYGWPDHVDIYSGDFPRSFARFAAATARVLDDHTPPDRPLFITPINEISFFAWAGGDASYINPHDKGRGHELKRQLVRAGIEAMDAMRQVCPRVRFVHCDPLIHVTARSKNARELAAADAYRLAQYQVYDMFIGEVEPGLGGAAKYLDIVGVNYYRNNQTYFTGEFIGGGSRSYKPLGRMLLEVWQRYRRPMMIAETGIEDDERAGWFRYVAGESAWAMLAGVDLHGITWYPIVDHPGWEDDRHCRNGLWGYPDADGNRPIHEPLAREMQRQLPSLLALRGSSDAQRTRD